MTSWSWILKNLEMIKCWRPLAPRPTGIDNGNNDWRMKGRIHLILLTQKKPSQVPTISFLTVHTPHPSKKKKLFYSVLALFLRCLGIHVFEHMFSVFKQYYTYFHTLFHPHIFLKKLKTVVQIYILNGPLILASW